MLRTILEVCIAIALGLVANFCSKGGTRKRDRDGAGVIAAGNDEEIDKDNSDALNSSEVPKKVDRIESKEKAQQLRSAESISNDAKRSSIDRRSGHSDGNRNANKATHSTERQTQSKAKTRRTTSLVEKKTKPTQPKLTLKHDRSLELPKRPTNIVARPIREAVNEDIEDGTYEDVNLVGPSAT
ncbi:unnamed protein product [Cylicocyclus nassatus]|uniref:Uncharacterized protein n=1 Tax=Cylicocyclus nassatus TaxID=53992 RepID=A0AA36GY90_CYLNA|nr:unnamed protein product [Cylicocyclus nassatus]